jgi:hypothetical protein
MNALWRRVRINPRWERGLLALAAITCIAVGLSFVSPALSWLAVGVFLWLAASDSGKRVA